MSRQIKSVFLLVCLFFSLPLKARATTSAEVLFQDAVVKDSGERDPEAAVELYRKVIEESGPDHRLASKARLRMGNCLERMGKPKEAEEIYLQIINESAVSLMEAVQAAQANLERLQAQEKKAKEEAAKHKPMVLVREFHDSGFSVLAGPGWIRSGNKSVADLDLSVRYRLSPRNRPSALSAEVGGLVPFGNSHVMESPSLKVKNQIYLGLMAELPHHSQKVIPELGMGAAFTSSDEQTTSENTWSPRLSGGLKFYPERKLSYVLEGSYSANPYVKETAVTHLPASLWTVGLKVQIKIGSTKAVMRPKE